MDRIIFDYSLKTTEERVAWTIDALATIPAAEKTPKVLEYFTNYILMLNESGQTKAQRSAEYPITTPNRAVTINKRQISYEQIVASLESGEDGIYALINQDKNQLLDRREKFTQEDVESIRGLKELLDQIERLKASLEHAKGLRRYQIKKQIIECYQQIYILKASTKDAIGKSSSRVKSIARMNIPEDVAMDENDMPQTTSPVSLLVPEHVSFLLCYYPTLKEESWDDLNGDMHWLLVDLENLIKEVLADDTILMQLLIWKIDGMSNEEIREQMYIKYGVDHNEQYYSTLWRKRIPKMLSDQAKKNYITWFFTNVEYGQWKTCNKCGETKLAHPMFFSKNSNGDGFYSICKDCRAKKLKAKKEK